MFGRRNPDHPPPAMPPTPTEDDLNLDLLPDIPDIPPPEPREPATPPPPVPPGDPAWYASAPVSASPPAPSSAITQRLPVEVEPPAPSEPAPSEPASSAPTPPALTPGPALSPSALRTSVLMKNASAALQHSSIAAESVIGPDDFFDGRYRSERGVRIQGNARGSIESRQYIFVEAGALVEADLSAEDITVAGSFNGKIECRRRLEVASTGKVKGQVQTVLLVVQEGGLLDGELHMNDTDPQPGSPNGVPEPGV